MDLPKDRMQLIKSLLEKRISKRMTFRVTAPPEYTQDPSVVVRDGLVENLSGTQWKLDFSDGTQETLEFAELMVLTYNLTVAFSEIKRHQQPGMPALNLRLQFTISEIMTDAVCREVLGKLTL